MVGGQLCLVHVCRVLTQLAHKLVHVPGQVVHHCNACHAQHVVVFSVQSVVHQAVYFASVQKVSGRALGKQPGKTAQQAFQGHVPVFVLLPVPPVQQKVRADLHQGKHRRLRHLAPRRPLQLLAGPLQLCLGLFRFALFKPRFLGVVVHHGVSQDAVVLEPLGGKHGQLLQHLVGISLDACPLHHGIVGLGLLDHLLVHPVHGLPVVLAALLGGPFGKFARVVLHIGLAALPQRRHRHLVHAVDPPGQGFRQLVHSLFCRREAFANAGQFAPLAAALAPLQQHVPVFRDLRLQRRPLLRGEVLYKGHHRRHGVGAQHGRRRGQTGCLRNGHARIQSQDRPGVVAPQPVEHLVGRTRSPALLGLQVGQQVVDVLHRAAAPLLLDDAVFQVVHAIFRFHVAVQHLLHVPDGQCQARIGRRVPDAALHHIAALFQQNGLHRFLYTVLQKAPALNGGVKVQPLDLGRQGALVHRNGVVVFHPRPVVAQQLHAGLVDQVCGVPVEQFLHVRDPRPVVVGQSVFHRLQHRVRHRGAVGILQAAQVHGLVLLVGPFNVSFCVLFHVRHRQAAVQQMLSAVRVLQMHVQAAQHGVVQRHAVALGVGQADVHRLGPRPGKGVHLFQVGLARHVRKEFLSLDGDLALPALAVVQHPRQLLHLAVLCVAAQHAEHPLAAQHVQLVLGQRVPQPVKPPAGAVALAGFHLVGSSVRNGAHFLSLCKAQRLVFGADHMQRAAGNGFQ